MPEGGLDFRLPSLHDGQKMVLREQKSVNFLCAGRGWRKSSLLLHLMKYYAFKRQEPVLWTSFTWDPITTVQTDQMAKMFGTENWDNMYDSTDHILQPPGWQPVYFASLEKKANQRGKTPGCIIFDEMGESPEGVYTSILGPMIFKSKGRFWGTGTPNPADPMNDLWLYSSQDDNPPHMKGWVIPVLGAYYDKGTRDIIRKVHPYENSHFEFWELYNKWLECRTEYQRILFRIEYLCEFLRDAGSQIENPRKACTVEYVEGSMENEWVAKGHRPSRTGFYQKSADLAADRDFLAIGAMDLETNKQVYMRHFIPLVSSDEDSKWDMIYDALERCDSMYPGKYYVDVTGIGNHVPSQMKKRGVKVEPINFSGKGVLKVAMHDNLAGLCEGMKIGLFKHDMLIKQLEGLKRRDTGTTIQIGNDVGGKGKKTTKNDDLATMCALMCQNIEGEEVVTGAPDIEKIPEIWRPPVEAFLNEFAGIGRIW